MKTYSAPSDDVLTHIANIQEENHPDLDQVTVGALFVFDDEASSEPVLKHNGYPAAAIIRITPVRDRTLGVADAVITVDRATWVSLTHLQRNALVDHELQHLVWVVDKEGHPKADSLGRPKLRMRPHDWRIEGFDEIVQRHGMNALESIAARAVLTSERQMLLEFGTADPQQAVCNRVADINSRFGFGLTDPAEIRREFEGA